MAKEARLPGDTVGAAVASSPNFLARFEFESGRSNEGSKILMVEWVADRGSSSSEQAEWHVSWSGKGSVLPAEAPAEDIKADGDEARRRLYFLLPPGVTVPPLVTLSRSSSNEKLAKSSKWQINVLPAIFPPELGASKEVTGSKGVLHTRWATARLHRLQSEIEHESEENIEGIGLEMALQERDWIESNFGLTRGGKGVAGKAATLPPHPAPTSPMSPRSPLSPGGSRLSEKLKGLRVGTSPRELSNGAVDTEGREGDPSSSLGDSERTAIPGPTTAIQGPATARPGSTSSNNPATPYPTRPFSGHAPPSAIRQQQRDNPSMNSTSACGVAEVHHGDELFAVAMSPRSPEMTVSPFSQLKTTMSRG